MIFLLVAVIFWFCGTQADLKIRMEMQRAKNSYGSAGEEHSAVFPLPGIMERRVYLTVLSTLGSLVGQYQHHLELVRHGISLAPPSP